MHLAYKTNWPWFRQTVQLATILLLACCSISIADAQSPFERQIRSLQTRKTRLEITRIDLKLRDDASRVQFQKLKTTSEELKKESKGILLNVALKQLLRDIETFSSNHDSLILEMKKFKDEEQALLSDVKELTRRLEAQNRADSKTAVSKEELRRSIQRQLDLRN